MKTAIEAEVTQDDINHGRRTYCSHCPVAKSLGRWLADGFFASVYRSVIYIFEENGENAAPVAEIPTPPIAAGFIVEFDQSGRGAPFSFPLEVPSHLLKPELREMKA